MVGFAVSGGLILLYLDSSRLWIEKANFRPFKYPFHAAIYFIFCGFVIFAAFDPPDSASPFSTKNLGVPWFINPVIGISALLWGATWWLGLETMSWKWQRRLERTRVPHVVEDIDDPGQYIQLSEVVDHAWVIKDVSSSVSSSEDYFRTAEPRKSRQ